METVDNVYEVPLILEDLGLGDIMLDALGLYGYPRNTTDWAAMVDRMKDVTDTVPIALVGKYVEYPDSYLSVREALRHAGLVHGRDIEVQWVHSEDVERLGADTLLSSACGIVVPGGFGPRGVEGMVDTVRYAREHKVPYLGLCLGLQVMVVEWARHVLGLTGANSVELDPDTEDPVVHIMEDQRSVTAKGGTMRLGSYPCLVQENTVAMAAYQAPLVNERHRHRFELNNAYREVFNDSGFVVGGLSPDGDLVETGEIVDHPFYGWCAVSPGIPVPAKSAPSAVYQVYRRSYGDPPGGLTTTVAPEGPLARRATYAGPTNPSALRTSPAVASKPVCGRKATMGLKCGRLLAPSSWTGLQVIQPGGVGGPGPTQGQFPRIKTGVVNKVKLFLDTANIQEIRDGAKLGVISGVTTNPSLAASQGIGDSESYKSAVREIADIVDGPISVEVVSEDAAGMIAEGRRYS